MALPSLPPRVTQTVYPPTGNSGVPTSLPPVGTTLPPAATALPPTPVPVPHGVSAPNGAAPAGNHGAMPGGLNSHSASPGGEHNGHAEGHVEDHGEGHAEDDFSKWIVTGEYLIMRPRRREQDYAILGSNPNWGPIGDLKNVDGGYDSGFRIGFGYQWCGGYEAVLRYTHFHSSGDDGVRSTATATVFPTLTFPAIVTQVNAANATNNVNLNILDVELARRWKACDQVTLRVHVGGRFANLDQKFAAGYTGGDAVSDVVQRNLTFDGGGLRAGGEVNYHFLEFFGVYARGSASMLVGRFRSSLSESANNLPIVGVSEKYDKIVPVVDLGMGVSFQKGCWRITLGYEFINWFGMVEGIDFADDAHPGKVNRRWADLGFDGAVIRAEYIF